MTLSTSCFDCLGVVYPLPLPLVCGSEMIFIVYYAPVCSIVCLFLPELKIGHRLPGSTDTISSASATHVESSPSSSINTVRVCSNAAQPAAVTSDKVSCGSNSTMDLLVGARSDTSSVNTSCLFPSGLALNVSTDTLPTARAAERSSATQPALTTSQSTISRGNE